MKESGKYAPGGGYGVYSITTRIVSDEGARGRCAPLARQASNHAIRRRRGRQSSPSPLTRNR
jgi:hypothetical protein